MRPDGVRRGNCRNMLPGNMLWSGSMIGIRAAIQSPSFSQTEVSMLLSSLPLVDRAIDQPDDESSSELDRRMQGPQRHRLLHGFPPGGCHETTCGQNAGFGLRVRRLPWAAENWIARRVTRLGPRSRRDEFFGGNRCFRFCVCSCIT